MNYDATFWMLAMAAWTLFLGGSTSFVLGQVRIHRGGTNVRGLAVLSGFLLALATIFAQMSANTFMWGGPFKTQQDWLEERQ